MLPSLTQLKKGRGAGGSAPLVELPDEIKRLILVKSIELNTVKSLISSLCKTNKEFAALCQENGVFPALLKSFGWNTPWVHGPDAKTVFGMLRNLNEDQLNYLLAWDKDTNSIYPRAFENCHELQLTTLPPNVTHISWNAFYGCRALALTALPSKTYSIGSNTFHGCEKLALTTLPVGLTYIGHMAFAGCHNLALTSLPPTLDEIGVKAFEGCTNLPPHVQNAIKLINPRAM